MGYRLHQIDENSKFVSELTLEAIGRPVPLAEVKAVIREEGVQEKRERKLNMVAVVFLIITMNIHTRLSIGRVMKRLAQGLRFIWIDPCYRLPRDSAIGASSCPMPLGWFHTHPTSASSVFASSMPLHPSSTSWQRMLSTK